MYRNWVSPVLHIMKQLTSMACCRLVLTFLPPGFKNAVCLTEHVVVICVFTHTHTQKREKIEENIPKIHFWANLFAAKVKMFWNFEPLTSVLWLHYPLRYMSEMYSMTHCRRVTVVVRTCSVNSYVNSLLNRHYRGRNKKRRRREWHEGISRSDTGGLKRALPHRGSHLGRQQSPEHHRLVTQGPLRCHEGLEIGGLIQDKLGQVSMMVSSYLLENHSLNYSKSPNKASILPLPVHECMQDLVIFFTF